MKPTGRTSLLTPERQALAIDAYSKGASHEMAADCLGLCESTIYKWMRKGQRDLSKNVDSKYVHFFQAVKKARYEYEMSQCKKIEEAADEGAWTARAWLLERRNPRVFGRNAEELRQSKILEEKMTQLQKLIDEKIMSESDF